MQELCDVVWADLRFQEMSKKLEISWIKKDLGLAESEFTIDLDASKLIRAAAILSCSASPIHRRAAFKVATSTYGIFGAADLPLNQALRVVLARLGNFPSFATRPDVENALSDLPLALAQEEMASARRRTVQINGADVSLTDFQHGLWSNLMMRASVSFSAPTSAGKSFVLQNYLASLFNKNDAIVVAYIVPTRALISQVSADLGGILGQGNGSKPEIVSIPIDSNTPLAAKAIYVMTQERLQVMLSSHSGFSADAIVVDEAHAIAEGSRGVLIQWVIDDLLTRNPKTQMLFATPAVKNLSIFSRLFGLENLLELRSDEATVAQNFLIVKVESATKGLISLSTLGDGSAIQAEIESFSLGQTVASRIEKLVQISAFLGAGSANIVYANGAAEAEKIALQLMDVFSERETTTEQLSLAELARDAVHPNYVLVDCVQKGIAFHYSNIPTQLRLAIEEAVSNGVLDYLVCTSTLLQGVNLPAKNLFMCFPEKGRANPLGSIDFWNLSGRAGRLRREFQGNIFLIDYEKWKEKPLEGSRETFVVPAIEEAINNSPSELVSLIKNTTPDKKPLRDLDAAFVRLFTDYKTGVIKTTLSRAAIDQAGADHSELMAALAHADSNISLPAAIIKLSPSISAHCQQKLYEHFKAKIAESKDAALALIPLHPREHEAYKSYSEVLRVCYGIVLKLPSENKVYKFHALIALHWIRGIPLPRLIDFQIRRKPNEERRKTIREMLDVIEKDIRFQAVRLFGCYNTLLVYALREAGLESLTDGVPQLPLFLEIGASDRTMISFISLGLSRVVAMKLNDIAGKKDMDENSVREWIASRSPESLGLSPLLLLEVTDLLVRDQLVRK